MAALVKISRYAAQTEKLIKVAESGIRQAVISLAGVEFKGVVPQRNHPFRAPLREEVGNDGCRDLSRSERSC